MNQLESRRGLWSLLHLQPLRTAEPPWCGLVWIAKHYPIMSFIAAATLGEDGAALRIQKYTLRARQRCIHTKQKNDTDAIS